MAEKSIVQMIQDGEWASEQIMRSGGGLLPSAPERVASGSPGSPLVFVRCTSATADGDSNYPGIVTVRDSSTGTWTDYGVVVMRDPNGATLASGTRYPSRLGGQNSSKVPLFLVVGRGSDTSGTITVAEEGGLIYSNSHVSTIHFTDAAGDNGGVRVIALLGNPNGVRVYVNDASPSVRGLVTTSSQSFLGEKTFQNDILVEANVNLTTSGSIVGVVGVGTGDPLNPGGDVTGYMIAEGAGHTLTFSLATVSPTLSAPTFWFDCTDGTRPEIAIRTGATTYAQGRTATVAGLSYVSGLLSLTGTFAVSSSDISGSIGPTKGGTGLTSYTTGDILYASASNVLSKRAIGSTGDVLTVSGGVPVWAPPAASGVTSIAGTANQITASASTGAVTLSLAGPHNYTTLTNHGILLGQGTSAIVATAVMTDGQLLVGQSAADPLPKTVSGSGATITMSAAGVVTISGIANATLTNSSLTVTAGTGLSGGGSVALGSSVTVSLDTGHANTWSAAQTFPNSSGIKILDTDASNTLGIILGSDLSADRTLTITPGDASRTVTLSGNLTVSSAATISGTNTGDQTITLTGNVTGSGTGSFATTIAAGVVTEAMQVLADNTTQNASTSKHGYLKKLSNAATDYMDGTGAWSVPAGTLNIDGLTAAEPAFGDELPDYSAANSANRKATVDKVLGLARLTTGGRLTLTSGTPVTTADVLAATTIYFTPYLNDMICLWDGTRWVWSVFPETSLALGTLTNDQAYDVFGYLSGGVLALEKLAWTSKTARATAVTLQDGRYCKSGDKTRLLLGSFLAVSTSGTDDAGLGFRLLANVYNRVLKPLENNDTSTRTTTSATFVQVGSVQIEWMVTLADRFVRTEGCSPLVNNSGVILGIGSGTTTLATGCVTGLFVGANESTTYTTLVEAPPVGATARYLLFRAPGGTATADGVGYAAGDRPYTAIRAMVEV